MWSLAHQRTRSCCDTQDQSNRERTKMEWNQTIFIHWAYFPQKLFGNWQRIPRTESWRVFSLAVGVILSCKVRITPQYALRRQPVISYWWTGWAVLAMAERNSSIEIIPSPEVSWASKIVWKEITTKSPPPLMPWPPIDLEPDHACTQRGQPIDDLAIAFLRSTGIQHATDWDAWGCGSESASHGDCHISHNQS